MFFKKDKKASKESVRIALLCTFIYWAVALFLNVILETLNKGFEISSLTLLITGVVVLFSSEFIAKYILEKKKA